MGKYAKGLCLTELDQFKMDFLQIASHELKTPLTVLLGYVAFLRDQVSGSASGQLEQVLSSAIELRGLIDKLVNLQHIRDEKIQLDVNIFSMRDLVKDILSEFQILINVKSLKVKRLFTEKDAINFEGDRKKIYLVIANLISNAVKFTPNNGSILVDLSRKGEKIHIRIADTGVGIPKDRFGQIFEDFYQVEMSTTRKFEGVGLGLPIVKGLVEAHRGEIRVDSILEKGSQFEVILPISVEI